MGDLRRGRARTRRPTPAKVDAQLLSEYRDALRIELRAVLAELMPGMEPGLFAPNVTRPPLDKRIALWGLADRLARNLAALDIVDPADEPPAQIRRSDRRGRIAGL